MSGSVSDQEGNAANASDSGEKRKSEGTLKTKANVLTRA